MGFGFFVIALFSSIVVVKIIAGTLICILKTLLVLSLLTYAATYFLNITIYGGDEDIQIDVRDLLQDLPRRCQNVYAFLCNYLRFAQNLARNYIPQSYQTIVIDLQDSNTNYRDEPIPST